MSNDTGRQYPFPPAADSNAIGKFEIGVSQIGDIIPFNYWDTIISQYGNSPVLTTLISNFQQYVDQTQNFSEFYDKIWNISTAQGFGLDVWGRIVGVNRVLRLNLNSWFGFAEAAILGGAGNTTTGFNQSPFYSGQPTTQNYSLLDETYRSLIYAKAAANITNGSIPAINRILMNLFPHRGNAYVTENPTNLIFFGFAESTTALGFNQAPFFSGQTSSHMTMQYVFQFPLTPIEMAIVTQSGVLPKPAGVLATVLIVAPSPPAAVGGPPPPPPPPPPGGGGEMFDDAAFSGLIAAVVG